MSKFDKKIPKGSVPNWRLQICNRYAIRWFKCKLKPPKKALASKQSVNAALASLHARPLGDSMPSPAEILHGRSITAGKIAHMDINSIRETLIDRQAKYQEQHNNTRAAHKQGELQVGEQCYFTGHDNKWQNFLTPQPSPMSPSP